MIQHSEIYAAKILLFGEYTVLLGSRALSIPFYRFSAKLAFPAHDEFNNRIRGSNLQLHRFAENLREKPDIFNDIIDIPSFIKDASSGLYLESDIPVSYGLGSSGALCAAVYGRYNRSGKSRMVNDSNDLSELRTVFSEMELFFHGKSSGFDPLVIYMNRPLCLNAEGLPVTAVFRKDNETEEGTLFLVDTGQTGKTASLVPGFLAQFAPDGKPTVEGKCLSDLTDRCIGGLLDGNSNEFREAVCHLSALQIEHFQPMIPASMIVPWREGLKTGLFHLKLCGSGGGGYLLGLTKDIDETFRYFSSRKISILSVSLP